MTVTGIMRLKSRFLLSSKPNNTVKNLNNVTFMIFLADVIIIYNIQDETQFYLSQANGVESTVSC